MMSSTDGRRKARGRHDLNINTSLASRSKTVNPQTPPPADHKPPLFLSKSGDTSASYIGSLSSSTTRHTTHIQAQSHVHESFLDNATPVEVEMANAPSRSSQRDSHDLSLSPRNVTRDSLVANMLLSLDQFSMGQLNERYGTQYDDHDDSPHRTSRTWTSSSAANAAAAAAAIFGRSRGHSHSYSSDLEGGDDSSLNLGRTSRGRRSNSSSNYNPSRLNSVRESVQRSAPGTSRGLHSRSRKGSKSSSINSFDGGYSQAVNNQRRTRGFSRSASFDYSPQYHHQQVQQQQQTLLQSPQSQQQQLQNHSLLQPPQMPNHLNLQIQTQAGAKPQLQSVAPSPFHVDFSNDYLADECDAAPTSTIRRASLSQSGSGSRPSLGLGSSAGNHQHNLSNNNHNCDNLPLPLPPPPPHETSIDSPTRNRNRSTTQSPKNSSGRGKHNNSNSNGTNNANTARDREAPSSMMAPAADFDSAPSPNVGYEKSNEAVHNSNGLGGIAAPAPSKERPGFFRRVFGGAKNHMHTASIPQQQYSQQQQLQQQPHQQPPQPVLDSSPLPSPADYLPPVATAGNPPPRDASTVSTLQKKPSSFFRRRKKSICEDVLPPPPVPSKTPAAAIASGPSAARIGPANASIEKEKAIAGANGNQDPSPSSSLRKVMNPYLKNGNGNGAPGQPLATTGATGTTGPSPLVDMATASPATPKDRTGNQEYKRDFSPDYEPSPNARIRTVDPESDDDDRRRMNSVDRPPVETRNNSFLNLDNGSDAEDYLFNPSTKKTANKMKKDDTIRASRANDRSVLRDSDDEPGLSSLALPIEGARATSPSASTSTNTDYKSANSGPPSVRVEASNDTENNKSLDEPEFVIGDPTEDDRQKAFKIYQGSEDFISKEKAAAFIGEEGPIRQRTLQAYMELYNFRNTSVVQALRQICQRLILRAETQQVDRILVAFSKRWCDCNPNHGFKATDVIHTICYSIMLLNTDLHVADIEHKMTRSQFVKNTMTTISQAVSESVPDAFDRPSILTDAFGRTIDEPRPEQDRRSFRNSFRPPPRADSGVLPAEDDSDCGPLVKSRFYGSKKAWEEQIELVLKGTYASIRDGKLPLFGAEAEKNLHIPSSQSSLSVKGMLKRSPSVLSKAPSESQISTRGRINDDNRRAAHPRWASKSRSRPGFGRHGFSSSRTSFDDGNSLWSPAMSSATWSRYSLGRTQTTISQDSFGSSFPRGDYQQSIGFANALSQAIIRDEDASIHEGAPSIMSADLSSQLLEDESLELAGPPWVKEGNVVHKHHLDGVEKKAKDRQWSEVFVVIQKGQMNLFSFNTKSLRHKSRSKNATKATVVGGGNWQDNATNVGSFNLRQTLASALPMPGYSRTRPHVWALSLPTGAVHLFQVGTPENIKEFVNTVNYWSARLSTHPLVGGISNIEYGWSDAIVNNALVTAINGSGQDSGRVSRPNSSTAAGRRSSISGSFRNSSFDHVAGKFTNSSGGSKLPGDRIHVAEWAPPSQSMRPSNESEANQLKTLDAYVKGIEAELQTHNQLRSPMLLAFSPRSTNAAKAMANWERRSSYLLREIVKFRTYVDCLQQAEVRKNEIYMERDLAQRAARGELCDADMEVSGDEIDLADETLKA